MLILNAHGYCTVKKTIENKQTWFQLRLSPP